MAIIKPIPDIHFEQMQLDDLPQVMKIEKDAFPDPWHESIFKRELKKRKKRTHLFITRLNDKVVGYIVFYIFSGECHIMNIVVDTPYRRRGVGKYLLESTLEIVQKNAVNDVFLEVSVNNIAALELYQKFEFQVFGVRKRYYGNGDDAYVLRKEIHNPIRRS